MIRNTNIRLELGVYGIKTNIQKSRLRWFGRVMRMGDERIYMKILHTKWREKTKRKTPNKMEDKSRKYLEMKVENWDGIHGKRKWEIREGWRFPCNSRPMYSSVRKVSDLILLRKSGGFQ